MKSLKELNTKNGGKKNINISSNINDMDKSNLIDRLAFVLSKTCITTDCQQIVRMQNDILEHIDN